MKDDSLERDPQPADKESAPLHLATYQVDEEDPVIHLDGIAVIDARHRAKKPENATEDAYWFKNRTGLWYNPGIERLFSKVVGAIRGAYTRGEDVNLAFCNKMRELGHTVDAAKVLGEMPEHWNPNDRRNTSFKKVR